MDVKNTQDLRAAYPELCKQLEADAVNAERNRIKDIEASTIEGFEELANAAKYDKPETASDFALKIIAQVKKQGADYLKNRDKDAEDGGVNNVETVPLDENAVFKSGKKDAVDEAIDRLTEAEKGGKK